MYTRTPLYIDIVLTRADTSYTCLPCPSASACTPTLQAFKGSATSLCPHKRVETLWAREDARRVPAAATSGKVKHHPTTN